MKKQLLQNVSIAVLFFCGVHFGNAQTWTLTDTISTSEDVFDITAKGSTLYAAVGKAGVQKSTDGGLSWTPLTTLPNTGMWGTPAATRVMFGSNGDLLVTANDQHSMGIMGAVFYRSTDNGATWNLSLINGTGGYDEALGLLELQNGTIVVRVSTTKIFSKSASASSWTQMTMPTGGNITMLEAKKDTLFIVTNLSPLHYSVDAGATWQRYGSNGTYIGTAGSPQICKLLVTDNYKFLGYGGSGIFRSGVNDTMWVSKSTGLPSPVYTSALASDGSKIFIAYQESGSGNTCKSGYSTNNGDSWTAYPGNTPQNSTLPTCLRKIVPMGTDIYTFATKAVYKMANVAQPSTVYEIDANQKLSVYPNPVVDTFTIRFEDNSNKASIVRIMDMHGKIVFEENLFNNVLSQKEVKFDNLSGGVYILNVLSSNGKNYNQKIVIQ